MCRAALESSEDGKTIAEGLANGILLLLILPYGLLATFGFFIYRAYRKKSSAADCADNTDLGNLSA